jgi:hypothetical protein
MTTKLVDQHAECTILDQLVTQDDCITVAVQHTVDRTPRGASMGRFDVSGQRLVTPPIRGWADELKVVGALVTALMQGGGGVLVIEGRRASVRVGC